MMVLVSYDISTTTSEGRKRLRKVAEECQDFGRRVQFSIFECDIDPAQWEVMKHRLLRIYNEDEDSLRFYFLGSNWKKRVEHHGAKKIVAMDEFQIV
jgi:CRISPR-associated protein Cas2